MNNLMPKALIFLCYIFVVVVCKSDVKFRVEKLNFIWNKATSQLAEQPARLEKLKNDLLKFDDVYLNVKQDLHHAKTSSGKGLDEVDRKLESILERYDLEETIHAFRMKYKYDNNKIHSTENAPKKERHNTFDDSRIQMIWDSVKDDKAFTLVELDDLYYDLREHEQKVHEYNSLIKELAEWEKHHNRVGNEHDEFMDEEHTNFVNAAKKMNAELENNVKEFDARVKRIKTNPFKQTKVRLLWEKAVKKQGLIPNELDVIKAELRHFEQHLNKMDYHRTHTSNAEEFERGPGKSNYDADDTKLAQELREQHEKILQKIKKLEHYLNEKIDAMQHSEL